VTWNFLDASLDSGKTYPVSKLMRDLPMASRLMDRDSNH
jgi:hypothetical protein